LPTTYAITSATITLFIRLVKGKKKKCGKFFSGRGGEAAFKGAMRSPVTSSLELSFKKLAQRRKGTERKSSFVGFVPLG
jgi:hypothetical protein